MMTTLIGSFYHRVVLHAQAEGFVAVAVEGNMRRAAERLYISQPALSARIKGLEEQLRAPLFRRTRSGMVLTHAGRAYLPYAEQALESLRGGAAIVAELAEAVTGELLIGAAPAVSAYVLPELLARYATRHPDVRLVVRTHHSEELVAMVARGDVQLAIVRDLRDARFRMRPLFEDELVLVARPDHPFALSGTVDVVAFTRAQLILFDRTSSYYDLTRSLFESLGVVPRGVIELDNIEAAKRMVERGLGVALLPGTAVGASLESGDLIEVQLLGAPPIRRRMVLVERGRGQRPITVTPFIALLDLIPELVPRARAVTA
jgi:DNA-binding transcriptional LysR family regulator